MRRILGTTALAIVALAAAIAADTALESAAAMTFALLVVVYVVHSNATASRRDTSRSASNQYSGR